MLLNLRLDGGKKGTRVETTFLRRGASPGCTVDAILADNSEASHEMYIAYASNLLNEQRRGRNSDEWKQQRRTLHCLSSMRTKETNE
jgi:hypothetical protein